MLHDTNTSIGHINVRFGEDEKIVKYIGHIGYGIDVEYRGNKFSAKACELAKKELIDNSIERVIITYNPENVASRKNCENIGSELIEIVDILQLQTLILRLKRRSIDMSGNYRIVQIMNLEWIYY